MKQFRNFSKTVELKNFRFGESIYFRIPSIVILGSYSKTTLKNTSHD